MRFVTLLAALAAAAGSMPAMAADPATGPKGSGKVTETSTAPRAGETAAPLPPQPSPASNANAAKVDTQAAAPAASGQVAPTAVAAPSAPTPPAIVVRVNLSSQKMDVTVGGAHRHTWPVSSGRAGYPTPRGAWRAQWTAKLWHSRKYDNAPMPHSIFFTGGYAIHATYATGMLGRPASHGCIRLFPANAATLYGLVQKHGARNTQVQVFGSPPSTHVAERRPAAEPRRALRSQRSAQRPEAPKVLPAGTRSASLVRLPSGSPYAGRDSFVHNGVKYVRVR
jgi:lipoprotein-anchoring transpeptidase ErfK/SrfK